MNSQRNSKIERIALRPALNTRHVRSPLRQNLTTLPKLPLFDGAFGAKGAFGVCAASWHKMMTMMCTFFLALGFAQKMPVIDAAELVRQNPVCVRVKAASKDGSKGQVLDVVWGSLLHKGDVFQLVERREYPPGTKLWYPNPLSEDSIVFMRLAKDIREKRRWAPDGYRIETSHDRVPYHVYPVYPPAKDAAGKPLAELVLDGRIRFRADVPRRNRKYMTYAEVKAELVRVRSKVGVGRL
jgi:hypothetical protein